MGTRRQEEAPFGGRLKSCMHGARADLLSMSYVVPKIAIYFYFKEKKRLPRCNKVIRMGIELVETETRKRKKKELRLIIPWLS